MKGLYLKSVKRLKSLCLWVFHGINGIIYTILNKKRCVCAHTKRRKNRVWNSSPRNAR